MKTSFLVLALGLLLPVFTIASPGDLDPLDANVVGITVYATVVQPDGKIIIAGGFSSVLGVSRNNIARLEANGTLDASFDPNANHEVRSVVVQADGKLLIAGVFTAFQPNGAAAATPRNRVARLNGDGTIDTGFDPNANSEVRSVILQPDGGIVLGGRFSALLPNGAASPTSRSFIARIHGDGTLDPAFDPSADDWVFCVAVQPDGKVLAGGQFTTLQPNGAAATTTRDHFARLDNDAVLQTLAAPNPGQILWQRNGAATELSGTTFELSTDGGTVWSLLGSGARIGSTSEWQLTGLNLPDNGFVRARGTASGGYLNGSSTPISPPSGPTQWLFQGPPAGRKFRAAPFFTRL